MAEEPTPAGRRETSPRRSARELLRLVADGGTFETWDDEVVSADPLRFPGYPARLEAARARAGTTEAVVSGRARVGGRDAVLVAGEFAFLAGSMGVASAERVTRAFERATALGLPVLGMPVSGGTRMQEGSAAFVGMAATAAAVRRHRDAGGVYVAWLRDPTTGGVLASWASLAQVTFAEPGALIGFTGPRVIVELTGAPLPEGVQVAEHLRAHGVIDDVVAAEDLAGRFSRVLAVTASPAAPWQADEPALELPGPEAVDGWEAVQRTRRPDRPGIRELLAVCATERTALRGDGAGADDPGCLTALARVCGVPAVVVGQDRPPGRRGARLGPAGYRKARRAMALAEELGLPLVTVVDTEGALISAEAEEGGLAVEIARCLAALSALRVPTLALLLGEGAGGGALALLPADRVLAAEHAWLAPIAPEGASAILHRTTARAPELAAAQAISATDLRRLGIVDAVVPDRPGPGEEDAFPGRAAAAVAHHLGTLLATDGAERLRDRAARWRRMR